MPTSFTSYWGSQIHGVEVTWTCDTSVSPNVLTAAYTSNYYWRTQLYYDSDIATDVAISDAIGGANFSTDMKAIIDSNAGADVYAVTAGVGDKFKMQLMIANPTAGASVPFDGFNGRVWFNPKTGTGDGVTLPSMRVEWVLSTAGDSPGTAHMYDLKPTSATDETVDTTTNNWTLLSTEAIHDDAGSAPSTTGTNLCKETWVYSNTAVACMKVTGTFSRDMIVSVTSTSNAVADTAEDFDFDFVDHSISAQFGKDALSMTSATMVQFAAITVPFSTFKDSETASALNLGGAMFASAMALYAAF